MGADLMRRNLPLKFPLGLGRAAGRVLAGLALAAALGGAQGLEAQAPESTAKPVAAHKHHAASHAKPHAGHAKQMPDVAPVAEAAKPVKPEVPAWPANEKPAPATIAWDSHGLRITASNASLQQIMQDVATTTGTAVEGLGDDVRVYGVYGPGQTRDVLLELLHGSGYNVLMIGDQGQGTPRQIVLSSRHPGAAPAAAEEAPAAANDDDTDSDDQPAAPPVRPGFNPGGPAHTPQQVTEDMRQRQQQMQQQNSNPQN
jgi:hypothetical protein